MKSFKELQYITELFDNPAPFSKQEKGRTMGGNYLLVYTAKINGHELKLNEEIQDFGNHDHEIDFAVDGNFDITNESEDYIKIFSTVVAMIEDIIKDYDKPYINFTGKSEDGSRNSLYTKMTRIMARKHGYDVDIRPDPVHKGYTLYELDPK